MKRKFLTLLSCFFILGTLSGCEDKTKLSAEEFKTKMSDKEFTVQDATAQLEDEFVEKVYVAITPDKYQIEFFEVKDEDVAKSSYEMNKEKIEEKKGTVSTHSEVNMGNHSKYSLGTDDRWMVVSRIDNTFIYLNVDQEYKEEVNAVLEMLGY